jgi:hypothetical protein
MVGKIIQVMGKTGNLFHPDFSVILTILQVFYPQPWVKIYKLFNSCFIHALGKNKKW